MGEKVFEAGVKRKKGFLYFVDNDGDISEVKMARGGKDGGGKRKKVFEAGIEKDSSRFIYYVDKDGDICAAERVNAQPVKKAKKTAAKKAPAKKAAVKKPVAKKTAKKGKR